jgi:ribosomal protein S18 acetylase RimI-like enzyme
MTKIELADISVRNSLRPGDLGYIAHIHGELYAKECGYGLHFEAYVLDGLKDLARDYDPGKDKVWVCEHQNKIIGFLVAQHREKAIQLRYFIFLPEYRGIGLGKKLMGEFVDFMKSTGVTNAYLWTTNEQHAAISLYSKFGFSLTEEQSSHTFDKPLIERRYDLHLATS